MKIQKGICGDDQLDNFTNSTLQSGGSKRVEFSIATFLEIPEEFESASEDDLAQYIEGLLEEVERRFSGLSFEVQIGPLGAGLEDDGED